MGAPSELNLNGVPPTREIIEALEPGGPGLPSFDPQRGCHATIFRNVAGKLMIATGDSSHPEEYGIEDQPAFEDVLRNWRDQKANEAILGIIQFGPY